MRISEQGLPFFFFFPSNSVSWGWGKTNRGFHKGLPLSTQACYLTALLRQKRTGTVFEWEFAWCV